MDKETDKPEASTEVAGRAEFALLGVSYFEFGKGGNNWLDFDDNIEAKNSGVISFAGYSYEIDSSGGAELSYVETKQLFISMMNYYKAKGDVFWVDD